MCLYFCWISNYQSLCKSFLVFNWYLINVLHCHAYLVLYTCLVILAYCELLKLKLIFHVIVFHMMRITSLFILSMVSQVGYIYFDKSVVIVEVKPSLSSLIWLCYWNVKRRWLGLVLTNLMVTYCLSCNHLILKYKGRKSLGWLVIDLDKLLDLVLIEACLIETQEAWFKIRSIN